MESHGTRWFFIWRLQSSMEFHGISLGNSARVKCHKMAISKFHGIPWKYVILHLAAPKFHGIPWNVPWNSMELNDMSFGGTRVPWNSMEYSMEYLCHLKWCPLNSMESHGTRWFFIWRLQSSLEFHWISLGSPARVKCHKKTMSKFHGIPRN